MCLVRQVNQLIYDGAPEADHRNSVRCFFSGIANRAPLMKSAADPDAEMEYLQSVGAVAIRGAGTVTGSQLSLAATTVKKISNLFGYQSDKKNEHRSSK